MKILGVIPARMAATRFPGKPMVRILGIPMIEHCYLRSKMCDFLDETIVATCDNSIYEYIHSIGGKVVMTSDKHERATERTAEALIKIEKANPGIKYDLIIMIQGDEPLINPEMIKQVATPLLEGKSQVSNLMVTLKSIDEINNPNNVKVVNSVEGNALYMSREPIPSSEKFNGNINYYRQLGLIGFSRHALLRFVELAPSELEIIESVDMNRFLENGISINMVETNFEVDAIDIPEDLIRVELKMKNDKIFPKYKGIQL
jgi:3-deoxy-manno-octulosonate cytidylyltransferase (CMP-KDO synthetase)